MSDTADNRYGINRNRWRRVYGRTRKKPQIVEFFDSGSQQNFSFDTQKIYRHRDYFIVKGVNRRVQLFTPVAGAAQYEEGLLYFNNETEITGTFNTSFRGSPYVVYSVETPANGFENTDNINVFGDGLPTTTQMFVGTSAPYSGTIRYRAIYSTYYPVIVSSSYSGSITASAGKINVVNAIEYTASYNLSGSISEFRATFHDSLNNHQADTYLTNDSLSDTSSSNSLSAESSGQIHFISYKL